MPKLSTPVQYEPSLEGLNDIRPLQLADEGKIVIPYPVLCKNPPSKDKPAVGMFARCSQQGALLKSNSKGYKSVEYQVGYFLFAMAKLRITFTQVVSCLNCSIIAQHNALAVRWTNYTWGHQYQDLSLTAPTFLSFRGTDLYLRAWFSVGDGYITVRFTGFY